MADIRINQLPAGGGPAATDFVPLDNGSTRKATVQNLVEIGRPAASQPEAEAGVNPTKVMTPLTTKQAVDFYGLTKAGNLAGLTDKPTARTNLDLGNSATLNVGTAAGTVAAGDDTRIVNAIQTTAIGVSVQAFDAGLQSISGLTTAADRMIYTTAPDAYATTALTPFARSLLDDATATDAYTTLGAVPDPNLALRDLLGEGVNLVNSWRGYTELNTWTATGAAKSNVDGYLKLIASGASTQITLSGLTINGGTERYVAIRYRRTVGTPGWDSDEDAFAWSTSGHGFTSSFLTKVVNTAFAWKTVYFDMWNPSLGGTDWKTNTITGLRFFAANGVGADIDIAWIATAADAPRRGDAQNDARYENYVRPSTTGAVSAPYIMRLKDMQLTLREMGFVSGNARVALNAALASGERIYLNDGVIPVDGDLNTVTNTSVFLEGSGFGRSQIVFTGNTKGLVINQDNYLHPTQIRNVAFVSTLQEPGTALDISYSKTDSITNRNLMRCLLEDVECRGNDINSAGWLRGIVLNNVHRPEVIRPKLTGRKNMSVTGPTRYTNMVDGIKIFGDPTPTMSSVPSEILIDAPRIDMCANAISSTGEVEGLIVRDPEVIAAGIGVFASYSTTRPMVSVRGGHIYAFSNAVSLQNAPQSIIDGVLVYKPTDANADTNAIFLNNCDDSRIVHMELQNQAANAGTGGQFNGIVVQNSLRCVISDIKHVNPSKTVILSGTTDNTLTENIRAFGTFSGATVQLYDDSSSGTANDYTQSNKKIANVQSGAVVVTSSPTVLASHGPIAVNKGDRFRIDGFVNATKGGTAGEFLAQLDTTVSGGAAASFGAGRSSLLERNAQAASASVAQSLSGVLTVTATGSLAFRLIGTSTGSNADVIAGDGQLSIVQL